MSRMTFPRQNETGFTNPDIDPDVRSARQQEVNESNIFVEWVYNNVYIREMSSRAQANTQANADTHYSSVVQPPDYDNYIRTETDDQQRGAA